MLGSSTWTGMLFVFIPYYVCVNWLSDPILFGRLIKHVNEMDEGVFLSYSSPSCYLAALNSDPGQVFVCLYVFSLPSHYHGAGVADQARRLLPLRLGPTRLLDWILLFQADLKVHDQANVIIITEYLFQNTKYQILDWLLNVEAKLKVDDQADRVDERAPVQDCWQ